MNAPWECHAHPLLCTFTEEGQEGQQQNRGWSSSCPPGPKWLLLREVCVPFVGVSEP